MNESAMANGTLSGWKGFYDGLHRGFTMVPGKPRTKEVLVKMLTRGHK